jgi:DNA gyrase subunit A
MAKQLNMLSAGQVITTALHTEMQQSYLEYAMSVIVGRALPDVRDGLKPVHRRILYAMHELGLTPDRPYRKCARVVGDVLGKYHPHGDQAVYDALVRMVQDFSSRYPLLGGHGNFGSVDDDPPAAMRYTETRLSPISHEGMLAEIGDATVDFIGNFDNSQQEPTVLPAQLPFLLLNGSSGIAVGMATNIPPHNLGEVIDGLIALIDAPNLSDEKLFELIPAPDFPTGGEIIGTEGIREAYLTGRGSITVRGVARIEEIQPGRGRHRRPAIVVTELPYQVNKAAWIEKIAELVAQTKLDGIADIRDESDREGIRVVIELKREANPQKLLNALYKQTALQTNFGAILLALSDRQPRQLTLRELLQQFLDFREQTLTRRYQHELTQFQSRLHVLEAMLIALEHLNEVIEILQDVPDGSTAKAIFHDRFNFSEVQSEAILAMPLRRLIGIEREKLQQEFDERTTRVEELQKLLGDRRELLKALKKDLRVHKKKYGDDRRTRIVRADAKPTLATSQAANRSSSPDQFDGDAEDEAPPEEVVLEVTQRGYVRRLSPKVFQRQRQRTAGPATAKLEDSDDFVTQTEFTTTAATLVVLTRTGKAYPINVRDIPVAAGRTVKGVPLVTLLPPSGQVDRSAIVGSFLLPADLAAIDLLLLTQYGRIKRVSLSDFADLSGRGLIVLKLKEDDSLAYIRLIEADDQLVLATSGGRMLRFEVNADQLPVMSRTAQGNVAIRLRKQERIIGCTVIYAEDSLLLTSELGLSKRLMIEQLRLSSLGDLGTQAMQFTNKADALVGIVATPPESEVMILTSANRMMRLPTDQVALRGRDERGERVLKLNSDERVLSLVPLPASGLTSESESVDAINT